MTLTAPFPFFGGKGAVARQVWDYLGDCERYIEPFCGSAAVLLGRPETHRNLGRYRETINDKAHFVANFWRAVAAAPDDVVAAGMDWPINETDLHSRQQWLVTTGKTLVKECEADPDFYDTKVAAWWAWGASCWIGSNWATDGRHAKPNQTPRGVNRLTLNEWEVSGFQPTNLALRQYILALSTRLRQVRVLAGDWKRCVKRSELDGRVGIFLDPPYDTGRREPGLYYHDQHVTQDVLAFCQSHPNHRIVLAGLAEEYDLDWPQIEWKANRAFATHNQATANVEGRKRERLWVSPACVGVRVWRRRH
jgi:DNA adenine methylase